MPFLSIRLRLAPPTVPARLSVRARACVRVRVCLYVCLSLLEIHRQTRHQTSHRGALSSIINKPLLIGRRMKWVPNKRRLTVYKNGNVADFSQVISEPNSASIKCINLNLQIILCFHLKCINIFQSNMVPQYMIFFIHHYPSMLHYINSYISPCRYVFYLLINLPLVVKMEMYCSPTRRGGSWDGSRPSCPYTVLPDRIRILCRRVLRRRPAKSRHETSDRSEASTHLTGTDNVYRL